MKIAWVILASALMRMFASAEEVPTPTPASTPPPRVYPVALPNYDEETATRLQIFLDNTDFGPGKIDVKMGEFFRKALISYKHAHATTKACSTTACARRITITFRPARIISSGFFGWV